MQTAINPGLAQVLGAMDVISPVTPEGTPTVAAQVMQAAQKAMTPQVAMPQVAQQAGLAGQIQAMQMQEAQKAMMQAAMRGQPQMQQPMPPQMQQMQQQMPQGIERLNPQMGNFAQGGIVGYAEAGMAEDEMIVEPSNGGGGTREAMNPLAVLLRRLAEMGIPTRTGRGTEQDAIDIETARAMQAPVSEIPIPEVVVEAERAQPSPRVERAPVATSSGAPAAAPRAAAPQGVAALAELARKTYGEMATAPATPEQVLEREQRTRAAYEQFLRSQGIDPDAFTKRAEEDKALMEQQRALLRERMEREQGRDTFMSRAGAALRGFRQMKGQGTGGAFMGAYENLARQVQSGEMRMDQFRDMEIRLNELEITRRRALDDSRRATAEGRWKDAERALATEQAASNEIKKLQAATYIPQANAMVQERQAQEAGAARRADQDRVNELYRLRLNTLTGGKPPTDEQKMEAMEYALQAVKGAAGMARKPSPQEMRQRMLEQYADNWEKMDLMEKNQLLKQGINTYEEYVKYRDRIAGVASTAPIGGASSDLIKRADAIVGGR
jgi:hypothetical protein